MITLCGNLCMFFATFAAYISWRTSATLWPVIPVCFFIYLACDCWDGKQSRRTNTCSVLGDFLDHFFDILIMGETVAILFFAYDFSVLFTASFILAMGFMSLLGSYYELYYARTMVFESIGVFEMMVVAVVFTVIGFVDGGVFRGFVKTPLVFGISIFDMVLIFSGIVGFLTLVKPLVRVKKEEGRNYGGIVRVAIGAALMLAAAVILGHGGYSFPVTLFLISAYSASYVERFFMAHLFDKKAPWPDVIFPVLLLAINYIESSMSGVSALLRVLPILYQTVILVFLFVYGFNKLKDGWVWHNPPQPESSTTPEVKLCSA
jgi:phosphatidylglycerophosphate synthase